MRKRIGFFITDSAWKNYQRWIYDTVIALYAKGDDVVVITPRKSKLYTRLKRYGIEVLPFQRSGFLLADIPKLKVICRHLEVSSLVINHPRDIRLATLGTRQCNRPNIIFRRGTLPVHKKSWLDQWLIDRFVALVITNSKANRQEMKNNARCAFQKKPIEVVYSGIHSNSEKVSRPVVDPHKNGELLVGISNCSQDPEFSLRFFDQLEKAGIDPETLQLVVFQDWSSLSSFQKRIRTYYNSKYIRFARDINQFSEFLKHIDVYISPVQKSSFNYALLYAMAGKKPVVGINGGSNKEIIAHNQNGYLVEKFNFEALFDKLEELKDQNKRFAMGEKGKKMLQEKFSFRDSAEQLEQIVFSIPQ